MKNKGNMTSPQEYNNFSVTDCKEVEIYNMSDMEFEIVVLRKPSELQEDTKRYLSKIRKIIQGQNEKFNRKIEIIRKNQTNSGVEYNESIEK